MYTNQARDTFNPGTDLTVKASTAVTGKRLATLSGDKASGHLTIKQAADGDLVAGVIKYDAPAGTLVGLARGAARIITVTAGAALTAGTEVQADANGKAIPATTGKVFGYAVTAAQPDTDAEISLNR